MQALSQTDYNLTCKLTANDFANCDTDNPKNRVLEMGLLDPCKNCFSLSVHAIILSPLILQMFGIFGSSWVPNETCSTIDPELDCCSAKRKSDGHYWNGSRRYTNESICEAPFVLSELDATAFSFQLEAFGILLLPFIFGCFELYFGSRYGDFGCCSVIGGLCFLLYPVAGVLNFIGCMIIAGKFAGSKFGTSFNVCLASGLYVLAMTGILIAYIFYKRRQNAGNNTAMQAAPSAGAEAPTGSGQATGVLIQNVNITERAVVHDTVTGGFFVFMRSINISHMVTQRG